MSVVEARRRAERCLAVARSTTHEGERQAAIGRAEAILAPLGLTLTDLAAPPAPATMTFTIDDSTTGGSLEEALRRFGEAMHQFAAAVGASAEETIYAARRRNFDAACAAARERDRRRGRTIDR